MDEQKYHWSIDSLLEVSLDQPDNFLKVRETLTRIGIASKKDQTLFQSCHILHKKGQYYICMFKELFALDGKPCDIMINDIERRNTIAILLQEWGLVKIIDPVKVIQKAPLSQIKIVAYKEKTQWNLVPKYSIGNSRKELHNAKI